jgi:hypothetical protein
MSTSVIKNGKTALFCVSPQKLNLCSGNGVMDDVAVLSGGDAVIESAK